MANLTAKPQINNTPELGDMPVPVNYSQPTGLALLLANMIASGEQVIPYMRPIPTAQFISGDYIFPLPEGYVKTPFQLPMLEPTTFSIVSDIFTSMQPVMVYQIGNRAYTNNQGISVPADYMTTTFPININPTDYTVNGILIKPLELNQSVIIRIFKNNNVAINWVGSNIVNNGLTDEAIQSTTELTFVVRNILGVYEVIEWLKPNFITTNMSALQTTAKNNFAAVINEVLSKISEKGGGDVTGPTSSINGCIPLFSGTTGKIIKSSNYNPSEFVIGPPSASKGGFPIFTGVGREIENSGYFPSSFALKSDINGFATESWVSNNFATEYWVNTYFATESWVTQQINAVVGQINTSLDAINRTVI